MKPVISPFDGLTGSTVGPPLNGATIDWTIQAAQKLTELGRLPHGWDSHGGLPLSARAGQTVEQAIEILKHRDLPAPGVVLGPCGNVNLEWRLNGRDLEINFEDSGAIEFVKVDERRNIEEGQVDKDIAATLVSLTDWLTRS